MNIFVFRWSYSRLGKKRLDLAVKEFTSLIANGKWQNQDKPHDKHRNTLQTNFSVGRLEKLKAKKSRPMQHSTQNKGMLNI